MYEDNTVWGLVAFLAFVGIGIFIWWFGFDTLWCAAEYWVPPDAVHVVARPTDCDFWRSPIGEKDCHYERAIRVYLSNHDIYDAQTGRVSDYERAIRVYLSNHDIYDAQTGRVSDFQTGVESNLDPRAQFNSVLVPWTKKTDDRLRTELRTRYWQLRHGRRRLSTDESIACRCVASPT